MENPEKLETQGTQNEDNKLFRFKRRNLQNNTEPHRPFMNQVEQALPVYKHEVDDKRRHGER